MLARLTSASARKSVGQEVLSTQTPRFHRARSPLRGKLTIERFPDVSATPLRAPGGRDSSSLETIVAIGVVRRRLSGSLCVGPCRPNALVRSVQNDQGSNVSSP